MQHLTVYVMTHRKTLCLSTQPADATVGNANTSGIVDSVNGPEAARRIGPASTSCRYGRIRYHGERYIPCILILNNRGTHVHSELST